MATTVFNAIFFAGVKPVEYGAHSFYIERYPEGREATVAWGSLDLKFRNDSGNAIYIDARATDTSVTITFLGTKKYDEIEAVKGPRTIVKQPATREEHPETSACRRLHSKASTSRSTGSSRTVAKRSRRRPSRRDTTRATKSPATERRSSTGPPTRPAVGQTGLTVFGGVPLRRVRRAMARLRTIIATMAEIERRKADEAGVEAVAPAITYAVVPGTTPRAVAAVKGHGRTPEKAAAKLTPGTVRRAQRGAAVR